MAKVIIVLLAALMFLQVIVQHGEGRELKSPHRTITPLLISHNQILTNKIKAAIPYSPKISEISNKRKHGNEFILPAKKNLLLGQIKEVYESLVQALPAQNQVAESSFLQPSSAPPPPPGHVDTFRPTAPGHSPGVGHSHGN